MQFFCCLCKGYEDELRGYTLFGENKCRKTFCVGDSFKRTALLALVSLIVEGCKLVEIVQDHI